MHSDYLAEQLESKVGELLTLSGRTPSVSVGQGGRGQSASQGGEVECARGELAAGREPKKHITTKGGHNFQHNPGAQKPLRPLYSHERCRGL